MPVPEKRLIRSKSGLRILYINESERSPFELSEPEWIKDRESGSCYGCKANFDFVRRKHHCRRCGQIYCNSCSKTKLPLPRMCFLDPVRLCSLCAHKTKQENNFYDVELKLLVSGVLLEVTADVCPASKPRVLHCCLSASHRHLLLSGTSSQSIPLINISVIPDVPKEKEGDEEEATSADDDAGLLSRLRFLVTGESAATELHVPADDPSPSLSIRAFLSSLLKAFAMTEEARPVVGTGM